MDSAPGTTNRAIVGICRKSAQNRLNATQVAALLLQYSKLTARENAILTNFGTLYPNLIR